MQGTSNALAVLDLDGEGSPDLLIGNYGPQGVMINDGDGRFSDGTARVVDRFISLERCGY